MLTNTNVDTLAMLGIKTPRSLHVRSIRVAARPLRPIDAIRTLRKVRAKVGLALDERQLCQSWPATSSGTDLSMITGKNSTILNRERFFSLQNVGRTSCVRSIANASQPTGDNLGYYSDDIPHENDVRTTEGFPQNLRTILSVGGRPERP